MAVLKKTVEDVDLDGKTALVRVDFNLPFRLGTTEVSDDRRIRAALPTLKYLLGRGCKLVVCSHLGRPKGKVVEELRLAPVTSRLEDLIGHEVVAADDCVGQPAEQAIRSVAAPGLVMLENLRFHAEEEANDPEFAAALASLADVFVNDAFGAAHRAHASTEGVAHLLPAVAGFLMSNELRMLGQLLESPKRPFVAILGGAKVSDKVAVIDKILPMVDVLIIGGGMAATFLKAAGLGVGNSQVEESWLEYAADLPGRLADRGIELLLPSDVIAAKEFDAESEHRVVDANVIPRGWRIMDIGPKSATAFEQALAGAKTVLWNGPMGVFEFPAFKSGTVRLANAVASLDGASTVVGGGSTSEAVDSLGLVSSMSHVSTGGGASLEFLEGKVLPGVVALMDKD